jgi:hypothetical protein
MPIKMCIQDAFHRISGGLQSQNRHFGEGPAENRTTIPRLPSPSQTNSKFRNRPYCSDPWTYSLQTYNKIQYIIFPSYTWRQAIFVLSATSAQFAQRTLSSTDNYPTDKEIMFPRILLVHHNRFMCLSYDLNRDSWNKLNFLWILFQITIHPIKNQIPTRISCCKNKFYSFV